MKEIFRQYGSIMISSFVLIAIFAFFSHFGSGSDNGIFEIAGQIMESSCTNYSDSHVAGIEYQACCLVGKRAMVAEAGMR